METTYKCRCGQNLLVLEGERRIRCGACGEIINLPSVYWQPEPTRRPKPQLSQPKLQSRQLGKRLFMFRRVKGLFFTVSIFFGLVCGLVASQEVERLADNDFRQKTYDPDTVSTTVGVVTGVTAALSSIAGIVAWGQIQKHKKIRSIAASIEADEDMRKRINIKISKMLQQLDRVRNYERYAWGFGFPFVASYSRYIIASDELIKDINNQEQMLIDHIAQHRDEKAVDEALNKANEIAKSRINQLDSASVRP
jgi:hypothetical protein